MQRKLLAEFVGTFALVFAGTGAIVVNETMGGTVTHVGIALVFGLVVMAMIYALGDISGAHFNPAVTFGFWVARRVGGIEGIAYGGSQLLGALLASTLLRLTFPLSGTWGMTLPTAGVMPAFLFEVVLTFFLMFVIIHVATGSKEQGLMAGIAIGATVTLGALCGGSVSGASMNPARSIAPAVVAFRFAELWIYMVAPLLGAGLAIGVYQLLRKE